MHNGAKIYKQISETSGGEPCIVENLYKVLRVMCIASPLPHHNDSDVSQSTQNMNAKYEED